MGKDKVRFLSDHPGYSYHGDLPPEHFDSLGELEVDDNPQLDIPIDIDTRTVCTQCEHALDNRPWWKRWFVKPGRKDLYCAKSHKEKVTHPITGEAAFKLRQETFSSNADSFPFIQCIFVNITGTCRLFRVKMARRSHRRR